MGSIRQSLTSAEKNRMKTGDATKAWLKQELVTLLGFPEVDDILSYILTEFQSENQVAPYLTELLGVPTARAQAIASRLFGSEPSNITTKKPHKASQPKQKKQPAAAQAAPLVPVPSAPNSRIKQTKIKKPSKVLHPRIINCLQCGRIERNAARRCAFCDTELRYEELDEELMDPSAQDHMKRLVDLDTSGEARTTVLDTEEVFYDQVSVHTTESGARHRHPIVLNLDLEHRSFETVEAPAYVLTTNHTLSKDSRDLLQRIQTTFGQGQRVNNNNPTVHPSVVIEDEYNALYV